MALHLLYEHRAGALLLGIRASGLTPVQALIAGPEGEASAVAFGWQPPYPKRVPLLRRRAWADAVADHLAGQALRLRHEEADHERRHPADDAAAIRWINIIVGDGVDQEQHDEYTAEILSLPKTSCGAAAFKAQTHAPHRRSHLEILLSFTSFSSF